MVFKTLLDPIGFHCMINKKKIKKIVCLAEKRKSYRYETTRVSEISFLRVLVTTFDPKSYLCLFRFMSGG